MKRLALLVASAIALVLFTACNKDKEQYYTEQVEWAISSSMADTITYRYFVQEFTMKNNDMIYDPCSNINRQNGYIDFDNYCNNGEIPIIHIDGDSLVYDVKFSIALMDLLPTPRTLIKKGRKGFSFSYSFGGNYTCVVNHECHRIKNLSN